MSDRNDTIEARLAVLERDVARLKEQGGRPAGTSNGDWLSRIAGSMQQHPEFAEVLELGREVRRADQPASDDNA